MPNSFQPRLRPKGVKGKTRSRQFNEAICKSCGEPFFAFRRTRNGKIEWQKYCSQKCRMAGWVADAAMIAHGYRILHCHGKNAIFEHRAIAEKVLGRALRRSERVHHINGNKLDNLHSNLLICSNSYHAWLHANMAKRYQQEHF